MTYDEEKGIAIFQREHYRGVVDSCGGDLQVKCTRYDAECISRALQRVFAAGQAARSSELLRLLGGRQ